MVSLGNERGTGGGYFFNTDLSASLEDADDTSLLSSVLITEKEPKFKPFPLLGWFALVLQTVVSVGMFIVMFLIPDCFVLYITHTGVWTVIFLTSYIFHRCHTVLKRYGYLEFYRETRSFIKIPFIIVSLGNAVLLVCAILLQRFCPNSDACHVGKKMECQFYLIVIYGTEFSLFFPCTLKYTWILVRFLQKKPFPDVHQDDLLISCMDSHAPSNEIGFKDEDYREDVLEKQGDMILYLKRYNIHLSRKILRLTNELRALRINADN